MFVPEPKGVPLRALVLELELEPVLEPVLELELCPFPPTTTLGF